MLRLVPDGLLHHVAEINERHRSHITLAANPNRHCADFLLLVAQHQHERYFFHLGFTDLVADFFAPLVHFHPDVQFLKICRQFLGILDIPVGDRQNLDLHRRDPSREGSGVMLDQDADEPFHAAECNPVDHHRTMPLAVFADIGQIKPFRHQHIQLNGAALPGPADGILQVEVNFGTIESAISRIDLVGHAALIERLFQCSRRHFPDFVRSHRILRFGGQFRVVGQAESRINNIEQVHDSHNFLFDLRRQHEDVGIILREAPHPHQTMQCARQFMPVDQPQFRRPDREFTVAMVPGFVHQHAARAVHRLDRVIRLIDLGEIHVFLVMVPMAGLMPQGFVKNDRRFDFFITELRMELPPEVFQLVANDHAFGVEKREPRAFLLNAEEIQFLAELAMVPSGGFFQHVQIGVQVGFLFEGGPINPLQHFVLLAAAPVSASQALQFQRLDAAGRRQMRPSAKIRKVPLRVERNHRILRQVANQLHLVVLAFFIKKANRIFPLHFLPDDWQILLDDLFHFGFNFGQVFRNKRMLRVDVIVKSIGDPRTDAELHLIAEQMLHRLRHDMRSAVAKCIQPLLRIRSQKFDGGVLFQCARQIDDFAVHFGGQRRFCQRPAERGRKLLQRDPLVNLFNRPVFQCDFDFFHTLTLPIPSNKSIGILLTANNGE